VERRASFPTPFARGRSERAFGTLQDRLPKELKLAAVTDIKAANAFIPDIYLPEHNARFAVDPAGEGSAFTPIPGVDLDEILCVEEERQVGQDNCVSYRTLKLQIPESPMRPHFVKARVKVHVYPDGSHAVFHGPRCIGRYDKNGAIKDSHDEKRAAKIRSAARAVEMGTRHPPCPQSHSRTEPEEADKSPATKTGQVHSLSTGYFAELGTWLVTPRAATVRIVIV
jgi:hypothetical protein